MLKIMPLAAAASAALFAACFNARPAEAFACKGSYTIAYNEKASKALAENFVKAGWSSVAKSKYGLSWSVWNIAAAKTVKCSRAGSKWRCQARAKPCNYVVQ